MSFQPAPYAKRQKLPDATWRPNLDPEPPRPPSFHQPGFSESSHTTNDTSTRRDASTSKAKTGVTEGNSKRPKAERGNYARYYHKRRGGQHGGPDPRLKLMPKEWFKGARVLDVGCNSGLVTIEIAQTLAPDRITGVDIDEDLVRQAHREVELAWSRQAPIESIIETAKVVPAAQHTSRRDLPPHQAANAPVAPPAIFSIESPPPPSPNHFPLALPRLHGYLPIPAKHLVTTYEPNEGNVMMPRGVVAFPKNIHFESADWTTTKIQSDTRGYHVILALSVTKWIHLHGLNEGLKAFFARAFASLLPSGKFIVEAQPFSSYSRSARGSALLRANCDTLRDEGGWKDEDGDFERVLLEEIGFEKVEALGDAGEEGFRRPIRVYTKRKGDWV